jgi:peptide deformylase
MQREILTIPNPVLRTACDDIDEIDDDVKQLVEDLLENVDAEGRAGLAANQIGINLNAFSWNINGDIGYILNPEFEEQGKGWQETEEGCLSIPDLFYTTKRHKYARVKGIDLDGKTKIVEGEDLMAKCLQHEMGHMKGQLYIDTLSGDERKKAFRQLRSRL